MSYLELFLIAVGLSMDAFAVSLCKGLEMRRFQFKNALILGLLFGLFQAFAWILFEQKFRAVYGAVRPLDSLSFIAFYRRKNDKGSA